MKGGVADLAHLRLYIQLAQSIDLFVFAGSLKVLARLIMDGLDYS
ncbi:hypothetical protein GCM10009425_29330 [Pseudomonas asuensis]|uniref:Uncharacterized protein n=1 Tax=Pseudomonas asuensis TaxID=1825787 RepID=A0ABQ2GXF3_9PSED|nr:hypothetical protein GCM10009425_29330 [Pseudomonas asuensis]